MLYGYGEVARQLFMYSQPNSWPHQQTMGANLNLSSENDQYAQLE